MKFRLAYLWFLVPLVVVGLWAVLFYMPISSKIASSEREIESVKAEAGRLEAQMASLLKMKNQEKEMERVVRELYAQIPVYEQFPNYLRGVVLNARKHGVSIGRLNSLPLGDGGRAAAVMRPRFEIELNGRFLRIGEFLDDIKATKAFLGVSRASMKIDVKTYPAVDARLVVECRVLQERVGF
jgi:Tfp pilus assembly protein PilO